MHSEIKTSLARRTFLSQSGLSLGTCAQSSLLARDSQASELNPGLPGLPHFAPKAKRVIWLMMSGAPSHVDLFDHKPILTKDRGKQIPESIHKGQKLSLIHI